MIGFVIYGVPQFVRWLWVTVIIIVRIADKIRYVFIVILFRCSLSRNVFCRRSNKSMSRSASSRIVATTNSLSGISTHWLRLTLRVLSCRMNSQVPFKFPRGLRAVAGYVLGESIEFFVPLSDLLKTSAYLLNRRA